MLLSSKNDKSDGNKTFAVYSSYITLASNIFNQKKRLFALWFISVMGSFTWLARTSVWSLGHIMHGRNSLLMVRINIYGPKNGKWV